ncbi:hypothetical protein HK405_010741, partial [Cladochytrium tenue]
MAEVRAEIAEHAALQRALEAARRERLEREAVERAAGTRHHLLSTRAIPGVMRGVAQPVVRVTRTSRGGQGNRDGRPIDRLSEVADGRGERAGSSRRPLRRSNRGVRESDPAEAGGSARVGEGDGDSDTGSTGSVGRLPEVRRPHVERVPEALLRESRALKQWVRRTVGRNAHGVRLQPRNNNDDMEGVAGRRQAKAVQGPFL